MQTAFSQQEAIISVCVYCVPQTKVLVLEVGGFLCFLMLHTVAVLFGLFPNYRQSSERLYCDIPALSHAGTGTTAKLKGVSLPSTLHVIHHLHF